MTPNLTVGYMAEQINRGRLDGVAARGWRVEEAAAQRSHATAPSQALASLGAALVRLGERIQGTVRPDGTRGGQAALPAQ